MTVYVESNFVLEIALGQGEAEWAESILNFSAEGGVSLAVPSIALFEPLCTLRNQSDRRRGLMNRMGEEIRHLKRSQPHEQDIRQLEPMAGLFTAIEEREKNRLHLTIQRMFEIAAIIQVDGNTFLAALDLVRDYGFSKTHDAIICASILGHLRQSGSAGEHYFATRDSDFFDPDIASMFKNFGCVVVPRFEECARRLRLSPAA